MLTSLTGFLGDWMNLMSASSVKMLIHQAPQSNQLSELKPHGDLPAGLCATVINNLISATSQRLIAAESQPN